MCAGSRWQAKVGCKHWCGVVHFFYGKQYFCFVRVRHTWKWALIEIPWFLRAFCRPHWLQFCFMFLFLRMSRGLSTWCPHTHPERQTHVLILTIGPSLWREHPAHKCLVLPAVRGSVGHSNHYKTLIIRVEITGVFLWTSLLAWNWSTKRTEMQAHLPYLEVLVSFPPGSLTPPVPSWCPLLAPLPNHFPVVLTAQRLPIPLSSTASLFTRGLPLPSKPLPARTGVKKNRWRSNLWSHSHQFLLPKLSESGVEVWGGGKLPF